MYRRAPCLEQFYLSFIINDMCEVSTVMKCEIFDDDTNFLYTGDDVSKLCKIVFSELD